MTLLQCSTCPYKLPPDTFPLALFVSKLPSSTTLSPSSLIPAVLIILSNPVSLISYIFPFNLHSPLLSWWVMESNYTVPLFAPTHPSSLTKHFSLRLFMSFLYKELTLFCEFNGSRLLVPFFSDYSIPSMQFHHHNQLITITGAKTPPLTQVSHHQIHRMLHTNAIATLHSIYMTLTTPINHSHDLTPDTATIQKFHKQIQPILHHHSHIFSKPKVLPPSRQHDHLIHLTPDSQQINIKPYR